MSSHHIVREKQEPALLILGMENFADELLGQLLEWSPTVIATAAIAEKLSIADIKVDVIIGSAADDLQSNTRSIESDGNNDIQTTLNYLISQDYPAVNIITDSLMLDDYLPFAGTINLVIYCDGKKIYPVTSGFSKWKPAGEPIQIFNPSENISVTGLQKTDDGNYITGTDGFFSLQFSQPYLFITEGIL